MALQAPLMVFCLGCKLVGRFLERHTPPSSAASRLAASEQRRAGGASPEQARRARLRAVPALWASGRKLTYFTSVRYPPPRQQAAGAFCFVLRFDQA